ncbi:MAG: exo-alpha-sialidase [Kiritimatiellae bacterium]|nr:exo-alpha-sialidase [Kiritimatiellia bacterium]
MREIMAFAAAAFQLSAAAAGTTCLWKAGDGGVAVYRIPALCTAPNGDLVAVCDARKRHAGDLNSCQPINISARRSADGGKTWTRPVDTWTWKWNDDEQWAASDPSLIVDPAAKKIFLFYNVWECRNRKGVFQFFVQESSDNGGTWSKPRDISKEVAFPEWPFGENCAEKKGAYIFISSGSGIAASDGTLLHTLVRVGHGNALFGSTDHGRTWRAVGKPVANGDECKVVELSDGAWMVNSRWRGGGRQIHVSRDRGATWQSWYDRNLADPQCNAQIMRLGKSLLFTNCNSPKRRARLFLRESFDDGRTWNEGICVQPEGAAYSDMTLLPNGDIGIIYEGAGYKTINFVVVPRSDLASSQR